jgi:hypothetical protein
MLFEKQGFRGVLLEESLLFLNRIGRFVSILLSSIETGLSNSRRRFFGQMRPSRQGDGILVRG